ncbi:MAG: DNA replication protein [Pseudomonadota bacterium]
MSPDDQLLFPLDLPVVSAREDDLPASGDREPAKDPADQLLIPFDHRVASARADFFEAPSNRDAFAWLDRWPDWLSSTLVLYGPPGCGKTHLARIWAERAEAIWLDRPLAPDERPARARTFVIDDVAIGCSDEVAFFQFYNWLVGERGHLLLTARSAPAAWPVRLPDLGSRLRAAPAIQIGPPDDTLLSNLLRKLFDDRQLAVSHSVISYMLIRMERSFAAARSLVMTLDEWSLERHREISIPLVRELFDQVNDEAPEPRQTS